MRHNTQAHPLNAVLQSGHWNARRYLTAVAEAQRALGMSVSAIRPEKVSRWLAGATPDTDTQLAMAHMHGVPAARVQDLGWPRWLRLALPDDDEDLLEAWTAQTAVSALTRLGGPMKRRTLITYTPAAVTAAAALYSTAIPADATHSRGRRIGPATADHIDERLAALRRLDDELGSGPVHEMARADLALITHTLDNASYDETVARRLFAAAGEAARIAGWTAFDNGNSAVAERFYAGALRAAAAGDDPVTGATTLSFWAMQRYSEHDPQGGVHLIDEALRQGDRTGSARMRAMLHARASRAHAKAGNARACAHAETAALTAYAKAPHPAEEPVPGLYWVDLGELYSWFASNATDLNLPGRPCTTTWPSPRPTAGNTTTHPPTLAAPRCDSPAPPPPT